MVRSSLLVLASSLVFGSVAMAADLPSTNGPPAFEPPPPPAFSWSGIYIGGNAGISAGAFDVSSPFGLIFGTTDRATGAGFSGGGQIGANYQFPTTNFVVGVEADFQGSTLRGTYVDASVAPGITESFGTNVNWWGTARARLGYAFGNILPYVTGGFAYGRADDFLSITGAPGAPSFSWSSTRTGWTAGAGLEYALTHNLTVKAEYLYTDLGTWSYGGFPFAGYDIDTRVAFHTVRVGLNWKFDPWWEASAPVVAKY